MPAPLHRRRAPDQEAAAIETLARWLHDTTVRVCTFGPGYAKPLPFEQVADEVRTRYCQLAAAMFDKPPPGFKRTAP